MTDNRYRGMGNRRKRQERHLDRAIKETEDMTRVGISIITLFAGDNDPMNELYACFRFSKQITPRQFHSIVHDALEKEGYL